MKNKLTNGIKSLSPVVKKSSLHLLRQSLERTIDEKNSEIESLRKRNDVWAHEVRALRLEIQRINEFYKWLVINYPTEEIIKAQAAQTKTYNFRPLISIIVPVYNTDPDYLKTCIDSVIDQSYDNWELCIVDDASTQRSTTRCLREYATKESRIKLKRLAKNSHISNSSNKAINIAEGEFIALLDHDDFLWPNALFEVVKLLQDHPDADFIYSDEDKIEGEKKGIIHFSPYFKPDWSPHLLECQNYIAHFSVMRRSLVERIGGFDERLVGAQDWDLFLRLSEKTDKIYHIPTILYSWRAHSGSTAMSSHAKGYVLVNQKTTLTNHFKRVKSDYRVNLRIDKGGVWYPSFEILGRPLVSIVIPTKDKVDYLRRCLESILDKTTYGHYELIIVDTGSKESATKEYYQLLKQRLSPKKLKLVRWPKQPFNYSDACNFGAKHAQGDYLVMLNNDTEVITDTWLEDMLGYAQQPEIAAVGVKLYYPNMQIQHAGVTVGIGSMEPVAGHTGINTDFDTSDLLTRVYVNTVRDTAAVTAACMMVSTKKFWEVQGFDPIFRVTFNDVDLCLKFRKAGYQNIYLPFVELFHHESVSVGRVFQTRDMDELNKSAAKIRKRWAGIIDNDPFYNKNFYIMSSNFGLDIYTQ